MPVRSGRYALLIALLLFAGSAAAQWSIYFQREKGGPWQEVTTPAKEQSEHRARYQARLACTGAFLPDEDGISLQHAAKFVSPSGKETVIQCDSPDDAAIGRVHHVFGSWIRVPDRRTLTPGQLLYDKQSVTIGNAIAGRIVIELFGQDDRWEKSCSVTSPCSSSYRPKSTVQSGRGFWSFLSSFWRDGRQLPPSFAGARGFGDDHANHALVPVSKDAVDLHPALANLRPGRYTLRLIPAPGGSLEGAAHREIGVTLDTSRTTRIQELESGLYLLSVADEAGQTVGSPVLVLLRDASDASTQAIWQEAAARVAGWPDDDAATKSATLAQVLYALDARHGP